MTERPSDADTAIQAAKSNHHTLFDVIHSRDEPHEPLRDHVHHHDQPLHWRHLYKRPVVRQFVVDDVYVQETQTRVASRFELFL